MSQQISPSRLRKGFLVIGIVLLILGFFFFYAASLEYRNYVTTFKDTVNVSLPVPLKIADYGFGNSLVFPTSFPDIRMQPNDLLIVECPSGVSAGQIAVKVYVVLFGNTSMLQYSKAEVLDWELGIVEYKNYQSNEFVGVYLAIPAWNIPNNVTMLNTAAVPTTITLCHYETLHWVYFGIGVVLASLAVIPIFKSKK